MCVSFVFWRCSSTILLLGAIIGGYSKLRRLGLPCTMKTVTINGRGLVLVCDFVWSHRRWHSWRPNTAIMPNKSKLRMEARRKLAQANRGSRMTRRGTRGFWTSESSAEQDKNNKYIEISTVLIFGTLGLSFFFILFTLSLRSSRVWSRLWLRSSSS